MSGTFNVWNYLPSFGATTNGESQSALTGHSDEFPDKPTSGMDVDAGANSEDEKSSSLGSFELVPDEDVEVCAKQIEKLSLTEKQPKESCDIDFMASFRRIEEQQVATLKQIRKLLDTDKPKIESNIDRVIESGVLPNIIGSLGCPSSDIRYEATWILVNVAAGNSAQTRTLIDSDALWPLINLLETTDLRVVENVIWCLSNIALEGRDAAREVCKRPLKEKIKEIMCVSNFEYLPKSLLITTIDLVRNLGTRLITGSSSRALADLLLTALFEGFEHRAGSVVEQALGALDVLIRKHDHLLNYIMQVAENVRLLVKLLDRDDEGIRYSALKIIITMLSGTDAQTQWVINYGVMDHLRKLIDHEKLRARVLQCLSNICAGTQRQNLLIRADYDLFRKIACYLDEKESACVHQEVSWIFANLVDTTRKAAVPNLRKHSAVEIACKRLVDHENIDEEARARLLESMRKLYNSADLNEYPHYRRLLEKFGGCSEKTVVS